jgi:hypothetical protein
MQLLRLQQQQCNIGEIATAGWKWSVGVDYLSV